MRATTEAPVSAWESIMPVRTSESSTMMSSPSITTNGSSPDVLAGHRDRVTQPHGLPLAHVVEVRKVGEAHHIGEVLLLALGSEVVLELEVPIEMVLEASFGASGDDEDVVETGSDRLLDHVLDCRPIHDREHLLGLRLGGGQEPRAKAGGRDHRLGDLLGDVGHRVPCW